MKTLLELESAGDSQLVELCLRGNRNAFGQIVARYQSIICAIAYSACGDIGRSEDIAQDTFVAAWRNLGELKEPDKLKSWICGIARNLTNNSVRQQQRTPTTTAGPLPPEYRSGSATPHEETISKEEEALMWRALETIPETYREPMILYYRENQSTQAVAAALELSEDAVRQRLSRGREMITERVAKTVESALLKSAPGRMFTIGVLAALPAVTTSTKAAAIAATAAKGSALAKGAGLAALFSGALGPILGFLGPYIAYKVDMADSRSPEARRYLRRFIRILFVGMALFVVSVLVLVTLAKPMARSQPWLYAKLWIGICVAYGIFVAILACWSSRQRKTWIAQAPPREPAFEYRSRFCLLGLPLVHIRIRGGLERGPVRAWFAAGDWAIGVIFAFGAIAVAPVSFGGFAIGLLTLGGFAIGLAPCGGFSLGMWAMGGFAVGWQAFGGFAAGWLAAEGGMAVAHDFALGGLMEMAGHANDAAARAFFKNSSFYQNAQVTMRYLNWLNLVWLLPLVLWWRVRKLKKIREAKETLASM
jgi:RNA polymerase sigma factor (sigma-70 family)